MSGREPDDPDRRGEPTDIDSAFAEIVAGWGREAPDSERTGSSERTGAKPDEDEPPPVAAGAEETVPPVPTSPPEPVRESTRTRQSSDEDHFIPPDPPPMPVPRPATVGALVLLGLGMVLVLAPELLGIGEQGGLLLGLLLLTGGLGWLVLRLRQGPPRDSGWDDGAQL